MEDFPLTVSIPVRGILRWLRAAILVLVAAGIGSALAQQYAPSRLAERFYLDSEGNVAGFFSSAMMLAIALLAGLIARFSASAAGGRARRWAVLACIAAALAVDESVGFHEYAAYYVHRVTHLGTESGHFAWVVLGSVLVAGFVFFFSGLLFQLPARTRQRLVRAGTVYVAGALGLEYLGGYLFVTFGARSLAYLACTVAEETLEMAGLYLAIRALLPYLREAQATRGGPPRRAVM